MQVSVDELVSAFEHSRKSRPLPIANAEGGSVAGLVRFQEVLALSSEERRKARGEKLSDKLTKQIEAARKEIEAKYGTGNIGPYDQFELGMINGKLSALRWVLGDKWDFLGT